MLIFCPPTHVEVVRTTVESRRCSYVVGTDGGHLADMKRRTSQGGLLGRCHGSRRRQLGKAAAVFLGVRVVVFAGRHPPIVAALLRQ